MTIPHIGMSDREYKEALDLAGKAEQKPGYTPYDVGQALPVQGREAALVGESEKLAGFAKKLEAVVGGAKRPEAET